MLLYVKNSVVLQRHLPIPVRAKTQHIIIKSLEQHVYVKCVSWPSFFMLRGGGNERLNVQTADLQMLEQSYDVNIQGVKTV